MFASTLQNAGSPVPDCCSDDAIEGTASGGVAPPSTPGAGVAGRIESVTGTVAMIRGNGAVEAAVPGALLQGGDFLQAADSSAVVELSDGHRIAIQEHGRLIVGSPADGATVVEAAAGRFIVFSSADGPAPAAFLLINTPVAQIRLGATDIAFQHAAIEGLRVVLAANRAAGDEGVLVENASGRAIIREGDEVVIVEGSDHPPILSHEPSLSANNMPDPADQAEVTSGLTLAEGLEVSPGGDIDALSGEPIVVTGDMGLFDLKPEPASLQEPTFTGVLTSDSGPARPLPMTEELLLRAAEQQLLSDEPSQQQQQSPTGRVSDTGVSSKKLRDWEPLGLVWDVFGDADVTRQLPDVGADRLRRQILPTEAATMALVVPATQGMGPIDDFLGLPPLTLAGALPSARPASISAIRSTQVELTAGTELSFDWFFDTANELPRHDTALFVIDGRIFALADATEVSRNGATGWRSFAYKVETNRALHASFCDRQRPDHRRPVAPLCGQRATRPHIRR